MPPKRLHILRGYMLQKGLEAAHSVMVVRHKAVEIIR